MIHVVQLDAIYESEAERKRERERERERERGVLLHLARTQVKLIPRRAAPAALVVLLTSASTRKARGFAERLKRLNDTRMHVDAIYVRARRRTLSTSSRAKFRGK